MFTKQELIVILQLIGNSNIKGGDALAVASIMQKIEGLIKKEPEPKDK